MRSLRHNPLLVGICNAVVPGLGYVILGNRRVFGWLLLVGSLSAIILSFVEPAFVSQSFFVSKSALGTLLEALWYLFFVIAYGYDAYDLAREARAAGASVRPELAHPDLHPMIPEKEG